MFIVFDVLTGVLKKAAQGVGTLPAVCCALAFWLGIGVGNYFMHGHLDPGYNFSNWFMNGTGFVMLFVLAYTANLSAHHASLAHTHANAARIHAGNAHANSKKLREHLGV